MQDLILGVVLEKLLLSRYMKRVRIPLPPLTVQQAIVNIYNCANEAKKIAAEADRMCRGLPGIDTARHQQQITRNVI